MIKCSAYTTWYESCLVWWQINRLHNRAYGENTSSEIHFVCMEHYERTSNKQANKHLVSIHSYFIHINNQQLKKRVAALVAFKNAENKHMLRKTDRTTRWPCIQATLQFPPQHVSFSNKKICQINWDMVQVDGPISEDLGQILLICQGIRGETGVWTSHKTRRCLKKPNKDTTGVGWISLSKHMLVKLHPFQSYTIQMSSTFSCEHIKSMKTTTR